MGRKNSKKKEKQKRSGAHEQLLKGTIEVTRSGIGFVTVENLPVDILVRQNELNTALHGDTVRVKIKESKHGGKRIQGRVVEVLNRKQAEFMGKLQMNDSFAFFIAETDRPMPDIYIPRQNFNGAKNNDRVVVRMLEWEEDKRPLGEAVTIVDEENSNDVAMKEILLENGFPLEFPDDALEIAARLPDTIS